MSFKNFENLKSLSLKTSKCRPSQKPRFQQKRGKVVYIYNIYKTIFELLFTQIDMCYKFNFEKSILDTAYCDHRS